MYLILKKQMNEQKIMWKRYWIKNTEGALQELNIKGRTDFPVFTHILEENKKKNKIIGMPDIKEKLIRA